MVTKRCRYCQICGCALKAHTLEALHDCRMEQQRRENAIRLALDTARERKRLEHLLAE